MSVQALHGRVAALARFRGEGDPDLAVARRDLRAEALAAHVERVVAEAPPLTDEQRARISALLAPAREHQDGAA